MKVRMFCDWDNDSTSLIERLRAQTPSMDADGNYRDTQFVDDNSYDTAVLFNFSRPQNLMTVRERNVCLLLEPPEIVDYSIQAPPHAEKIYSFAIDSFGLPAIGMGFATAPAGDYPKLLSKTGVSMITSDKVITPWQVKRRAVKDALLETDLPIDFYGRNLEGDDPRIKGTIPPFKKQDVLSRYAMSIDFENSGRSVVTDKFFDPVICDTVPITNSTGLSNLAPGSFGAVDFNQRVDQIVDKIATLIESDLRPYVDRLEAARESIFDGDLSLAKWINDRVKAMK